MPQVFRIGSYWVYFWVDESIPLEPIHVHVAEGKPQKNGTKIWITKNGHCSNANVFGKDINDMIVGTGSKNNCQDWADKIRTEYKILYKELPKEDRKRIKNELKNYKKECFNEK